MISMNFMALINDPELIKRAMSLKGTRQHEFAREIGRSQAQLSKYLSGKTSIPADVSIHCMNILRENNNTECGVEELICELMALRGEVHKEIREALMKVIRAYSNNQHAR